ncbi:unnamed protein product [Tilletia controversa]|nr:unnamed protein product [Tilletia controversa]CAD6952896.1 unnamed protein product [Tilletia caries]CAD7060350.1 unnamed protein product [Tilletia caries]
MLADGSQELTTIIEAICADGSTLPPTFVFKGKCYDATLCLDAKEVAVFTSSESGWTNALITQRWFEKVFLPYSLVRSSGGARLLIMDGHSSHFTLEMLKLAQQHNVHVLSLPSHSTHGMAPLDRTCFSPLKVAWAEAQRMEFFMTGVVRRDDVVRLYEEARLKSMTPANVIAGYRATGIWPLTGVAAIPAAMFAETQLSEAELEEAESDAWLSDSLAEALWDLLPVLRSRRARETVVQASRRIREASAEKLLFKDTVEKLRMHAASLKAKPRAFRVAEKGYGQAKLWTQPESIAEMEAARAHKQQEEARLEQVREERELRREQKEIEDAEKKKRQEIKKAEALAKKIEKERAKKEAKQAKEAAKEEAKRAKEAADRAKRVEEEKAKKEREALKRKAAGDGVDANKPKKRSKKIGLSNSKSPTADPKSSSSEPSNPLVLQPTQLANQ